MELNKAYMLYDTFKKTNDERLDDLNSLINKRTTGGINELRFDEEFYKLIKLNY